MANSRPGVFRGSIPRTAQANNLNIYIMNTCTAAAWPGAGNFVHPETVRAESEEKALEIFCRRIIDRGFFSLCSLPSELTGEKRESGEYIHVDGTMSGAKYPVYMRSENLLIPEK